MAAPTITLEVTAARPELKSDEAGRSAIDFGFDATFRRLVRPAFTFLHDRYWRVETTGAANVPATGPALLVANHSGAVPFDGAMIVSTVDINRERTVHFVYDRFVDKLGPVARFYRKVGGVAATRDNALALLEAGELLLVFPEGVPGVAKPFGDRYQLRSFSPGFARLALALDVPVIPVAVVGAEEIYPLVARAEGIGQAIGAPYLPITPFFPLLGVLGALPLPTKWFIRFGKPMRLARTEGPEGGRRAEVEAVRLRRKIQGMVGRLKRRRRSVFFG